MVNTVKAGRLKKINVFSIITDRRPTNKQITLKGLTKGIGTQARLITKNMVSNKTLENRNNMKTEL